MTVNLFVVILSLKRLLMLAICHNNIHSFIPDVFLFSSSSARFKHILVGITMAKDNISLQLGERWAGALKKHFPERNTTKHIAQFFEIEPRTARSWLDGQAPQLKYLFIAAQKLGADFIAEILDTPKNKMVNINKALEELESKICQLGAEIRSLRGGR